MNIMSTRNILTHMPYGAGDRHFSVLYFSGRSSIPYFRRSRDTHHTIRGEHMREAINIDDTPRINDISEI